MVGSAQSSEQCVIDSKSLHWRWWRALIQNKRTRIRWWSDFYSARHYNNAMRAFSLITAHLRICYGKSVVLHLIDGQFITWQSDRETDGKRLFASKHPRFVALNMAHTVLLTYNHCSRDIIFCKFRSKLFSTRTFNYRKIWFLSRLQNQGTVRLELVPFPSTSWQPSENIFF